jgi:hypothetical protein
MQSLAWRPVFIESGQEVSPIEFYRSSGRITSPSRSHTRVEFVNIGCYELAVDADQRLPRLQDRPYRNTGRFEISTKGGQSLAEVALRMLWIGVRPEHVGKFLAGMASIAGVAEIRQEQADAPGSEPRNGYVVGIRLQAAQHADSPNRLPICEPREHA